MPNDPWQLKSSKSGQVYTFESGVSQEEALRYIDATEVEPESWDVLTSTPQAALGRVMQQVGGNIRGIGDITTIKPVAEFGTELARAGEQRSKDNTPKYMTDTQKMVHGGVSSTLSSLPELAAAVGTGLITGGVAPAAAVGLNMLAVAEGGAKYHENREAGFGVGRSLFHGAVHGLAEKYTEKLPVSKALDVLESLGARGFMRAVAGYIGRDIVGEQLATAIQDLNDKLSINPNMTFQDYLKDAYITLGSTLVSGGVQGPVVSGLGAIGQKMAEGEARKLEEQVEGVLKERARKVDQGTGAPLPLDETPPQSPPTLEEEVQKEVMAKPPATPGDVLARKAIESGQEESLLSVKDPDIQEVLSGTDPLTTKVTITGEQGQLKNFAEHKDEIVHELGGSLFQVSDKLQPGQVYELGHITEQVDTNRELGVNIRPFRADPRILRVLRSWTTEFTPDIAILLRGEDTVGGYSAVLGEKLHVISLGNNMSFERQLDVLAHEFGHTIIQREFLNSSPKVAQGLYQEYLRALKGARTQKMSDFAKEWFSKTRTETFAANFDMNRPAIEVMRAANLPYQSNGQSGYFISFDEFLAERMARFMHDRSGFTPEARSVWQGMLSKLREFWNKYGKWTGSPSFDAFVQEVLDRRHGKPVEMTPPDDLEPGVRNAFKHIDGTPDYELMALMTKEGEGPQHWNLAQALRRSNEELGPQLATFNRALDLGLGALQLAKLNEHVPGVPEFANGLRAKIGYKNEWLSRANTAVENWVGKISKNEAAILSRVLYEEARRGDAARNAQERADAFVGSKVPDPKRPGKSMFTLDPEVAKKLGLSEQAAQVYSDIRGMFDDALTLMEGIGIWEAVRAHSQEIGLSEAVRHGIDNGATFNELVSVVDTMTRSAPQLHSKLMDTIDKMHGEFKAMREKPYMPFTRYGQWAIRVRDRDGKVVHLSTYETKQDMVNDIANLRGDYPGHAVAPTYIEDLPYQLAGMPPALLDAIATRLDLTPQQLREYQEIMKDMSATSSFVRKMKRRRGIEGYTEDALRGFSDYFLRFANYTSKVRSRPLLDQALKTMQANVIRAEKAEENAINLARLHEWFSETRDYVLNPGNELSELKSFVSLWYLGGNISSASINALQVPLFTLPYLSERYGTKAATRELLRAYKDVARAWKDPSVLPESEQAMFNQAFKDGFTDESFATTVAQISEGSALLRAAPVTNMRRSMNLANHYAMLPFQKMEEMNRRVTMLGAYRLAAEGREEFDADAYLTARKAVEDTQNEYALEARPKFMRGNKSLIFQFMSYSQNAIFQMFGGDASWKRLLLVQLAAAGILGLPFAEDAKEIAKWLARNWFGKDFDAEVEARKYMKDVGVNADWVLRGLTRFPGGVDISSRLSLGRIIPGVDAMASNQSFDKSVYNAVGDIGGAGISILLNAMKALASDDPDTFRRMMYVMPTSLRYVMKAAYAEKEGGVTSSGAMLAQTGMAGNAAIAAGFPLTEERKARELMNFQREAAAFWITRREMLMKEWRYVQMERRGDREAKADVMAKIREYNKEAPGLSLKILPDELVDSLLREKQQRLDVERGMGRNPQTRELAMELSREIQ